MKKTLIILGSVLLCVLVGVIAISINNSRAGGGDPKPGPDWNMPPSNTNSNSSPSPGSDGNDLADDNDPDKEKKKEDETAKNDDPERPAGGVGGVRIVSRKNGEVKEKNDEVELNSTPLLNSDWNEIQPGDSVKTNPLGVAILKFLECEDKTYIFEDSELSLEGCPETERKNSKISCVKRGLAAFKHTIACSMQSLVQSPGMNARPLGTWYAVAVRPAASPGEQESLLLVFQDSVELTPVRRIDSRGRFVFTDQSVNVPSGNMSITRIGETAGTTIGIREREAVPFPTTFADARSLYTYFSLTPKKLNSLFDQLWEDLGPKAAPVLPVPPPTISVSYTDFPNIKRRNVYIGEITIRNDSDYLVAVWDVSKGRDFKTDLSGTMEIKPKDILKVRVEFTPADTGVTKEKVIFRHTAQKDGTLETELFAVTDKAEKIDFGEQVVGGESDERTVEITQPAPLSIDKSDAGLEQFKIDDSECEKAAPGKTCAIGIRFAPNKTGGSFPSLSVTSKNLSITNNFIIGTRTIELAGNGVSAPAVRVSKDSVNFGKRKPQDKSDPEQVTVTVGKPRRLNMEISGPAKDQFAIENNTCKDLVQQKCSFNVVFNSTVDGTYLADLKISSAEPNETFSATVKVKGIVEGSPAIGLNARLCFKRATVVKGGKQQADVREQQTFEIKSDGDAPLVIGDVSISDGNDFKIVKNNCAGAITAACSIVVGFTPRATKSRESYLVIKHNGNKNKETRIPLRGVGKPRNPVQRFFQKLQGYKESTCT